MAIFPKLKVKPPKQAHHNLSRFFRTSMSVGPLYVADCFEVASGETHDFDFESLINTQALLSPLYGSFKFKLDVFFAGTSLYVPKMWRNGSLRTNTNGRLDANFPTFRLVGPQAVPDGSNIKIFGNLIDPSSLFAYLGFGAYTGLWYNGTVGTSEQNAAAFQYNTWNAIPYLMYLDIYRHYYVNRQDPLNRCYFSFETDPTRNVREPFSVSIGDLDDLFLNLPKDGGDIREILPAPLRKYFGSGNSWAPDASSPYGPGAGFALRCHMPDRMNVILNSSFYDQNITSVQVNTTGDAFTVDQFVTAKKLWNSRNKDAMSGGTFKDWVRMHYGVTPKIMDDMPTYCGSVSSDIYFEDIQATTNSQASVGGFDMQRLGDKASSGKSYGRSRRFRITADRPGYIMVLASIVPRVDYFQFSDRFIKHTKLTDVFNPDFNGIGLQDVLQSDLTTDARSFISSESHPASFYAFDPTENPFAISVGKQPAFIEYMTRVNKIRGSFCTTERSWVLSRDMRSKNGETVTLGVDPSAYIWPYDYNQPFADQAENAENFYVQLYIDHRSRSSVLKRLLPYL